MPATIKHIYTTSYKSKSQPPGFADFVIGSMSLFCFNEQSLYVDYSNHPINNFLVNEYNVLPDAIFDECDIKEFFDQPRETIYSAISEALDIPMCIATNTRGYVVSEAVREFAVKSFKPNSVLQVEIDKTLKELKLKDFEVIHIRLGDGNMFHQVNDIHKEFLENNVRGSISEKDVLVISDNEYIKSYLREKIPTIKVLNNKPIHLGDLINATTEDIKYTLLDFYLMSKSKKITCYSIYGGSGFSEVCSNIYNIPYNVALIDCK